MQPKGIVVHSTGANNPYLKRYVDSPQEVGVNRYGNHWNVPRPGGEEVCVHAFIGYDESHTIRVAEILPLNICCWGVGNGSQGSYNYDPAYIQFEICEDGLNDEIYYQKVFDVAAEYCADLCRIYNLNVNSIVGHVEASRLGYGSEHEDPEHWMKNFSETMDDFRRRVTRFLGDRKMEDSVQSLKQPSICKGDLVALSSDAVYYNGDDIPLWVKDQRWFVKSDPMGNRVVIDKNEQGTQSICSPIHKKHLKLVKANTESSHCPYRVKITTDVLNIRKGPSTFENVAGCITDAGVYTIIEEANGEGAALWGRLKSGAGWISLDYVKRV